MDNMSGTSDAHLVELLERKLATEDEDLSGFDFNNYDPENLHLAAGSENICVHENGKIYVFVSRKTKPRMSRINRKTPNGHWMGHDVARKIKNSKGEEAATKAFFSFHVESSDSSNGNDHRSSRPKTKRTSWVMYEFRLIVDGNKIDHRIVLCVVYKDPRLVEKFGD